MVEATDLEEMVGEVVGKVGEVTIVDLGLYMVVEEECEEGAHRPRPRWALLPPSRSVPHASPAAPRSSLGVCT